LEALVTKLPPLDRGKLQVHHGELTEQDRSTPSLPGHAASPIRCGWMPPRPYQIDLLSTDFDAFLRVENAAGREKAFDDDGGGDLNARLLFTPAEPGEYRVIVTTYRANQTGGYVLAIQRKN
jgi:hypothetical protein